MFIRKSIVKSICVLALPFVGLLTFLTVPTKAEEQRACGLYNSKGQLIYDRSNTVLDLTNTVFDPPMDINTQEKRCQEALTYAINQQLELGTSACPSSSQNLVGLLISAGKSTEIVRGRTVYTTINFTETRYQMIPICEVSGPNQCVYRYRPIPYQVPNTRSSCHLSA
jgi:hypothetical protein